MILYTGVVVRAMSAFKFSSISPTTQPGAVHYYQEPPSIQLQVQAVYSSKLFKTTIPTTE
ncbi:MAG: hypothetical protein ABI675_26380 [Chitinophagaceae bacterium]